MFFFTLKISSIYFPFIEYSNKLSTNLTINM